MVSPDDWMSSAAAASLRPQEIEYRNCISRAYYGVFHAAHAVAEKHFPEEEGGDGLHSHKKLIGRFTSSQYVEARRFGSAMHHFKSERCRADYRVDQTVTAHDAMVALSEARKLSALLDCIPPASSRSGDTCNDAVSQCSANLDSGGARGGAETMEASVATPVESGGT
jgi:uncharacterized protein (UPF0332 family)